MLSEIINKKYMRKLLVFLAICGAFALVAPAAHADNSTITGTITYASGGAVVPSAYMYAINTSTNYYNYGVADANGVYTFSLTPGTYDIFSTGVYADSSIVFIKKIITVAVADGETKAGNDIAVTRRGWFTGRVLASDGTTPVPNASLYFVNAAGSMYGQDYAETSSTGVYTAPLVPTDQTTSAVGTYTVSITKVGYFGSQVTGVVLGADGAAVSQDFRLTPASTVSGTVRDTNGGAIAGATVTVTKVVNGFPSGTSYTAITNASGGYTASIHDLYSYNGTAVSDYTMTVTKAGYVAKTSTFSITAEGTAVTSKDFTMPTGKVYSGTVVAKTGGAALANATVSLFKRTVVRSDTPSFTSTTGADGAYSFNTLPSGKYRLTVAKAGYATIVQDYVTITADKTGVKYSLETGGSVTGLVYTGASVGIDGASIVAYPMNLGKTASYLSTTADENGTYTLSGLKLGTYKLVISSTDHVKRVITVKIKNTTPVKQNVKLAAAGSVSGYVLDKDTGLPLNSTLIRIVGTSITASTDSNGFYTIDGVSPGTRKITALNIYYETPAQKSVKVTAGKTKTGVNFSLTQKQ